MSDNTALLKRAAEGDVSAEDELVRENMGLVWSVVRRFSQRGYEADDLSQVGAIGLIKAVKKFDFSYNVQFSTYAVPMIIGEIKRFMRDDGSVKISRSLKELAMKGYTVRDRLSKKYGREPSIGEIAAECGAEAEELVQAFEACTPPESIDRELYDDGAMVSDRLGTENDEETVVNRLMVDEALSYLKARERKIIVMRYFQGKTQSQVAEVIGVSQVQISRLEKAALAKMNMRLGRG